MAHFLFDVAEGTAAVGPKPRERAVAAMRAGVWGIAPDEPHRGALAPGDLVLLYLGAPERVFLGSAELGPPVRESSGEPLYPGGSRDGVVLTHVEEWDPPVPVQAVLSRIGPSDEARADFETGVVLITAFEYECALAVAAAR